MPLNLEEQEYMRLADGVGIIPPRFRNRGYDKLPFGPGEGGIGTILAESQQATADDSMRQFLAAIAAGADPKQFASELLHTDTNATAGRKRRSAA